jgi:poly(hydroxyalkanoate) depolymerase family esterase
MHMIGLDQDRMVQALNLTKAGRLTEATDLIQQTLGSSSKSGESSSRSGSSPEIHLLNRLSRVAEPLRKVLPNAQDSRLPLQGPAVLQGQTPPRGNLGAGDLVDRTYKNGYGGRRYLVYVPPGCPTEGAPVIVMLHGGTQAVHDYAAGTAMNQLADLHHFLVVYPEQDAGANPMRYWNWFRPQDQRTGDGEPALIAGITQQVISDYSADRNRVFIVGFSAGGAMATVMAATYPDLYAAGGIHSGLPYGAAYDVQSAFALMRGENPPSQQDSALRIPLIVFHGDRDQIVNVVNASRISKQRLGAGPTATAGNGVTATQGQVPGGRSYTRTTYAADADVLLELWIVHGAGHAWFGGTKGSSYTDPLAPDASAEIVRFFRLPEIEPAADRTDGS